MLNLNLKGLGMAALLATVASPAFATYTNFDNPAADVRGTELTFGSIKVTGGHSLGFNLIASSFTRNSDYIDADGIVQDTNCNGGCSATFGGLGVESGLTNTSDDNMQGSIGGNTNNDEILFFDYTVATSIDSIVFNGDHTDNPNAGIGINLFTSADNITYTRFGSNYRTFGVSNDTLSAGFITRYFAVAAVGPQQTSEAGVYIAGINSTAVPAPATLALLGLGLAGLGATRRKQK